MNRVNPNVHNPNRWDGLKNKYTFKGTVVQQMFKIKLSMMESRWS